MRYDLRVLWIDDSQSYYEATKELLDTYADDSGISIDFCYFDDVSGFDEKIAKDIDGFKLYDICFIDYNLSGGFIVSEIIKNLRSNKIYADMLFYSSDSEADIRAKVKDDLGIFEGVYIANKTNFEEKSYKLIDKNIKRLTSITNIRGFLMDQTSENDYTIRSYLLKKFDVLPPEIKNIISTIVLNNIKVNLDKIDKTANSAIKRLEQNGLTNIKKEVLQQLDFLLPVEIKYIIFKIMVQANKETAFDEEGVSVQEYIDRIVKARNNLAHKKLDVCKQHKYILYYDNVNQFIDRQCPENCEEHFDDNKYSLADWEKIRQDTYKFGKGIDAIQAEF